MDTRVDTLAIWIGRVSALAAVMFGLLVGVNLVAATLGDPRDVELAYAVLVGGSAVLTIVGGSVYLVGLERFGGTQGRSLRLRGWLLYTAGLLLPTGLLLFQLLAIAGGGPAAFSRGRRSAHDE